MEEYKLLTIDEVVNLTSFKKSTIYKYIKEKGFPHPIKFGRASRWKLKDITEWIEKKH
jgi:prophage regulatory protein